MYSLYCAEVPLRNCSPPCVWLCQERSDRKYQIEMWESTAYVELFFQATVPVSCSGCSASLLLKKHVGLMLSNCSVTFSASDQPRTTHSVRLRAVQTPGTRSRIVKLKFNNVNATAGIASWNGYKVPDVFVSQLCIFRN